MIKKDEEKVLSELIRKYKLAEGDQEPSSILDLLIASIVYFSKIRPNLNRENPLSIMEMLCQIFLATGKNPDRCADLLGISPNTIKTYEQRIREKLHAENRVHAFYIAQVKGYLTVIN